MTKPTQFGPARAFGFGTLGGDVSMPDGQFVTDCCDDDPPDRAYSLPIFIGADGSDLTLVQDNSGTTNNASSSITVTFGATPTPGNLMVALFSIRGGGGGTVPSGWTLVKKVDTTGPDSGSMTMWYRIVQTGDGAAVSTSSAGNYKRLAIAEFAGPGALSDTAFKDTQAAATSYPVGPVALTTAGMVVGASGVAFSTVPTFVDDPDYTTIDVGNSIGFGPWHMLSYETGPAGSYSYTPTSNVSDDWCGILAAFESGDTWILGGARTTDDDDATYETIASGNVLRIDLGTAYAIARVRLRIATETSGVRGYTLKGANEPDFSDAVTVSDLAFTALGSYTAQTVNDSWIATDSYRFWQLTGDDETRRIHQFELYEATAAAASEAAVDEHIADPTDAHDASAISILDTGGYYSGTDVEAALQEIGASTVAASDVTFTPAGAIVATDAQAAIEEVATDAAAALAAHAALPAGTDHEHIDAVAFSGDGSTTAFELPAAPFDEWSVKAHVAGLRTAVTMSGAMLTTMTFGSAPASGTDNVLVDIVAAVA